MGGISELVVFKLDNVLIGRIFISDSNFVLIVILFNSGLIGSDVRFYLVYIGFFYNGVGVC